MRISADATEGAAMDDAINVTTADARAPAKASCHFIGHPLPFNRKRPCGGIMARLRGYVKFIRKTIAEFSALSFRIAVRFPTGTERSPGAWRRLAPVRGRRQKGVL